MRHIHIVRCLGAGAGLGVHQNTHGTRGTKFGLMLGSVILVRGFVIRSSTLSQAYFQLRKKSALALFEDCS